MPIGFLPGRRRQLSSALGPLRLRRSGADGGHNGLKSIIQAVGTGFPRLRIGIGHALPGSMDPIDFVLGKFEGAESALLDESLNRPAEAMKMFMARGIDAAMGAFNA